jgi:hypothetical protein
MNLAAKARDCGEKGVLKLLILKEQSGQKQKRLRRIGGAILYSGKHSTFLKIVKRKIGSVSDYATYQDLEPRGVLEMCGCVGQKVPQMARKKEPINVSVQPILWYPRVKTFT